MTTGQKLLDQPLILNLGTLYHAFLVQSRRRVTQTSLKDPEFKLFFMPFFPVLQPKMPGFHNSQAHLFDLLDVPFFLLEFTMYTFFGKVLRKLSYRANQMIGERRSLHSCLLAEGKKKYHKRSERSHSLN